MSERAAFRLTPRQSFIALAVVLVILLIGLLVFLLIFLRPGGFTIEGGDEVAGLRPVLTIVGPGQGENPSFDRPMAAAYGPQGRIYVSDTNHNRVTVFDRNGRYLFEFGGFGIAKPLPGYEVTWEPGLFNYPVGIDVDDDGDVYVADFRNDSIQVYDADGAFIRRFPEPTEVVGRGASGQDGLGIAVTDVAVHDGFVYALDAYQVVVFTTEGEFVRQFGRPGTGPGDLDRPNGIAVADDGTVVVADSNNNRVQAFTPEGEVLWVAGEPQRSGATTETAGVPENGFGLPRGVGVMRDGTVVVVDSFEFEIVLLSPEGRVLSRHGERGVRPGQLNFPNGIDVLGDLILVSDKENDRVQVLEVVR